MKNITDDNPYNEISFSGSDTEKNKIPPFGRNIVFDAFQISVLFFPTHILFNALFYNVYLIELFALLICGIFMFFITLSDSLKHAGFKWLLSLPISFVWIFFIRTDNFNRRILNWLMPEFGEPNIGALGLAAITLMIYASVAVVAFGVGLGISGAIADRKSERFYNIISVMKKICAVVSIILAAVILLLDMGMPAYRPVYG